MRATSLALFAAAVVGLAVSSARADLPVAPAPRPVRPDGTRDPAPKPEAPVKAEDPAVVVDRIIKNSKDVGDKLEKNDTGEATRTKQDKILADIEALINRQEDPPPPKPDDKDKDKDKNKDMNKDPMNKDPMNKDPMNKEMPPKDKNMDMNKNMNMNMGGMQNGMPMGGMGMDDTPPMGGRRPRMGDPMGDSKKDQGDPKQDPMGGNQQNPGGGKEPKDPKNPMGNAGGTPGGKLPPGKGLPFDEDVTKDVWGHLPPKLRQQMTQYYKEDVMPKYTELLRLYYSSLSDKGTPGSVMPKK
jgi:hypothetical protein